MPGFILVGNNLKNDFETYKDDSLVIENIKTDKISIQRRTIKKFLEDKIFYKDSNFIILTEGVIFNKLELMKKYNKSSFKDTLIEMYQKNGEEFFSEFRGSFSGVFIDLNKDIKLVYTDQIADKQIFYFKDSSFLIIGTTLDYMIQILKLNEIEYSFDDKSAYCLLNHGFMLEDITSFKEIKKVIAGNYLRITTSEFQIKEYHRFDNTPIYDRSDDELIEGIDKLFLQALKRQTDKNLEYGYENFTPLSAGLDSRMVNFALEKLEVKKIKNFTYSQTGYYDESIPKKIADDLKRDWLFKSLDNGLSIKDNIDDMININAGQVLYYGPGQVSDIFENLNSEKMGIIHTGMLGDVIVGTFFKNQNQNQKFSIEDGAYSKKFINKLEKLIPISDIRNYKNQEMYNFYNRGFNGANLGSPLTFQEKTESFSPFYDLEFLEFCLSIPVEKRWSHYIYDKWVIKKYPDAARYLHNGKRKIGRLSKTVTVLGRDIPLRDLIPKATKYILVKIGVLKQNANTKHNMNPLDYWYNQNKDLKKYLDEYFEKNAEKIKNKNLKLDCVYLYKNGNTSEKTQVLTLLGIFKKYF